MTPHDLTGIGGFVIPSEVYDHGDGLDEELLELIDRLSVGSSETEGKGNPGNPGNPGNQVNPRDPNRGVRENGTADGTSQLPKKPNIRWRIPQTIYPPRHCTWI